jgi:small subunit ribosomal protein S20
MARVRDVRGNPARSLVQSAAVANIKSQIKRNRQNERRQVRNKAIRTELKTYTKKVRSAAADGDAEAAGKDLAVAIRQLDKAASRGVMHKRTAARKKSRLSRAVRSASAG